MAYDVLTVVKDYSLTSALRAFFTTTTGSFFTIGC